MKGIRGMERGVTLGGEIKKGKRGSGVGNLKGICEGRWESGGQRERFDFTE